MLESYKCQSLQTDARQLLELLPSTAIIIILEDPAKCASERRETALKGADGGYAVHTAQTTINATLLLLLLAVAEPLQNSEPRPASSVSRGSRKARSPGSSKL